MNINQDGTLSGYAWSENIGWINFAPAGPYPALPNYSARVDLTTGEVSGWARVLAYGGGWDGWIKLRGTNYGVSINKTSGEFSGWAWSDMVIGWISFNYKNQNVCQTSNYKVVTSLTINQPPSATNLQVNQPDYCLVSWAAAIFSWAYTDPDGDSQGAYQVQVDNNSDFSSPEADSGKVISSSNSYATLADKLSFNNTYYWRLMVWDSKDAASSWISGPSFTTPKHAYPTIDFSWTPQEQSIDELVQFTDQSTVYGGATKVSWSWTFQDGNPSGSSKQNATTTFTSAGPKTVTLRVTDSDGFSCPGQKTVNAQIPLPEYREVPPIIWLHPHTKVFGVGVKNFLTGVINFFNGLFKISNG